VLIFFFFLTQSETKVVFFGSQSKTIHRNRLLFEISTFIMVLTNQATRWSTSQSVQAFCSDVHAWELRDAVAQVSPLYIYTRLIMPLMQQGSNSFLKNFQIDLFISLLAFIKSAPVTPYICKQARLIETITQTHSRNILYLPSDLQSQIMRFLDGPAVLAVVHTCKEWCFLLRQTRAWLLPPHIERYVRLLRGFTAAEQQAINALSVEFGNSSADVFALLSSVKLIVSGFARLADVSVFHGWMYVMNSSAHINKLFGTNGCKQTSDLLNATLHNWSTMIRTDEELVFVLELMTCSMHSAPLHHAALRQTNNTIGNSVCIVLQNDKRLELSYEVRFVMTKFLSALYARKQQHHDESPNDMCAQTIATLIQFHFQLSEIRQPVELPLLIICLWMLQRMEDRAPNDHFMKDMIKRCAMEHISDLLLHRCCRVVAPALRLAGAAFYRGASSTQYLLDRNVLSALKELLKCTHSHCIRTEAMWAISNVAAGTVKQQHMLIHATLLPDVIYIVNDSVESQEIRRNGIWTLANLATTEDWAIVSFILELGGISCLCKCFNYLHHDDKELVTILIESLSSILSSARAMSHHQTTTDKTAKQQSAQSVLSNSVTLMQSYGMEDTLDELAYHTDHETKARNLLRMLHEISCHEKGLINTKDHDNDDEMNESKDEKGGMESTQI
jgi:hypothetical protein